MAGKKSNQNKKEHNVAKYKTGRWDFITGIKICQKKANKNLSFTSSSCMSSSPHCRE
jgi:hypothetical protein